jgi:hypothetical protein
MINILKPNGAIVHRNRMMADYTEVIVAKAKEQWLKDMKAEYDGLYPKYRDETYEEYLLKIVDERLRLSEIEYNTLSKTKIEIEYDHIFDSWLLETEVIEPAVEEVKNEYGMIETPSKPEATKLLREFLVPTVTEDDLDTYLKSRCSEIRAVTYAPIGEQLDMMYKDMLDGGTRFKDHISFVKESIPK